MPEAPYYVCTPSRLTSWLDCPRRFRMTYLDRPPPPKGPPWAHLSFGTSVHNALRDWWSLPMERRNPAAAVDLLDQRWLPEGYRDDAQSAGWRARAGEMVRRYVATLDPTDEPVGIERTVAVRTDRLALSGRIDRIDRRDGPEAPELVVVDYKTGRHALSVDEARGSLALAAYAVAAAYTLKTPCRRVELHHLPTGEVVAFEHTDATLALHGDRAEAVAAEARAAEEWWRARAAGGEGPEAADAAEVDEVFPPRPGGLCRWCDFVRSCPEGAAQGSPHEPWDALGEPG